MQSIAFFSKVIKEIFNLMQLRYKSTQCPPPAKRGRMLLNDLQKLLYAKDVSFTQNPGSSVLTHNCSKGNGGGWGQNLSGASQLISDEGLLYLSQRKPSEVC